MMIKNREIPFWMIATIIYISFLVLHIILSRGMSTPILFADELIPWIKARFIATGEGGNYPDFLGVGHPGYGIVLAPILFFIKNIDLAYKAAIILNACISSTIPVLALILIQKISDDKNPVLMIAIATLVGVYPAHLLYANMLMPEVIIVPIYLSICILAYYALEKQNNKYWGILGFFSGITFIFHPRLLILSIASIALSTAWKSEKNKKNWLIQIAYTISGTIIGLLLANFIMRLTTMSQEMISGEFDIYSNTFKNVKIIIVALENTALNSLGQIFYLTSSTYGLFLIGLLAAVFAIYNFFHNKDKSIITGIYGYIGIVIALSIALSSFFAIGISERFDKIIYGRYNEGFLAPLLIIAILSLIKIKDNKKIIYLTTAIAGTMAILFIIISLMHPVEITSGLIASYINILGVSPIIFSFGLSILPIFLFSLSIMLIFMSFWIANKKLYIIPISLLSILFFIFSYIDATTFLIPSSEEKLQRLEVLPTLNKVYDASINKRIGVDFDKKNIEVAAMISNYNFYIPFEFNKLSSDPNADQEIIATDKNIRNAYKGGRLINIDASVPFYLYSLPGKTQENLDEKKLLLPEKLYPIAMFDKENFYDNVWNNGDAILKNVNFNISKDDKTLIIHTKGWRKSYDNIIGKSHVNVSLNDKSKLELIKTDGDAYYYKINKSVKKIDKIEIHSDTFIPKFVGLNEDRRTLGIDIDSIEFSAEK